MQTEPRTRVFLSYSRRDQDFAVWIRQQLQARAIEVSRDVDDTLAGEEWWVRLQELIETADSVVFALSPDSAASAVCGKEVEYAQSVNKRIFPAVIADVDWQSVPPGLAKVHAVFFGGTETRDAAVTQLVAALLTDIGWVREHTRLQERARSWQARGRSRSELLSGEALERAEEWLTRQPKSAEAPTDLHRAYIKASRDFARRRQQRLVVSALVVATVATGLAAMAFVQRNQALKSQSIYLAKVAADQINAGNSGAAILLALAGLPSWTWIPNRPVVPEAIRSLTDALFSMREVRTFRGHTADVNTVEFDPSGSVLLTSSDDGTARLWDVGTGNLIRQLEAHEGKVYAARFSPGGDWIATTGSDNKIVLWSKRNDWEKARTFSGHTAQINSIAFDRAGKRVLTSSSDGTARSWSVDSDEAPIVFAGHSGPVYSAAFSPDGRFVVTASGDRTARVWDAGTGTTALVLSGHTDELTNAAFDSSGSLIVTTSRDRSARLWDANSGKLRLALPRHPGPVNSALFCASRHCLITISTDVTSDEGAATIWNIDDGTRMFELRGHEAPITKAVLDRSGELLATAARDGRVLVWRVATGERLLTLAGHQGELFDVAFDRFDKYLATASRDRTASLWRLKGPVGAAAVLDHDAAVRSIATSPQNNLLAAGEANGHVAIWDAASFAKIAEVPAANEPIVAICFGPTAGSFLAISASGVISAWAHGTSKVRDVSLNTGSVLRAACDGIAETAVVASRDGRVGLWDTNTGQALAKFVGHKSAVLGLELSFGGDRLLTSSIDGTVKLWETATGKQLREFQGDGHSLLDVTTSDSKGIVVAASESGKIFGWDASSAKKTFELDPVDAWAVKLAFSAGGRYLLAALADHSIQIWRASQGSYRQVAKYSGHLGAISDIKFLNPHPTILSASDDRTIQIWRMEADYAGLIDRARGVMPRCLSAAQSRALGVELDCVSSHH